MSDYILITDAAEEPVTLAEVKTALRIDGTDYDAILTPLIKTARQIGEKITGRDFVNKTWKLYLDQFPCDQIEVKKSKLQSITSISYYISDVLTLLSSTVYYKTEDSNYSSIYLVEGQSYPSTDSRKQAVEILFVSGYGPSAADVPQAIKTALISMITVLFESAGDCAEAGSGEVAQFKYLFSGYIIPQKMVLVW
jgi:uncharacterized phiE125 gp8 family phage protein